MNGILKYNHSLFGGHIGVLYDVFGIFVEVKDFQRAVVFIECCLGGASLLYPSSFNTGEVNLCFWVGLTDDAQRAVSLLFFL